MKWDSQIGYPFLFNDIKHTTWVYTGKNLPLKSRLSGLLKMSHFIRISYVNLNRSKDFHIYIFDLNRFQKSLLLSPPAGQ